MKFRGFVLFKFTSKMVVTRPSDVLFAPDAGLLSYAGQGLVKIMLQGCPDGRSMPLSPRNATDSDGLP